MTVKGLGSNGIPTPDPRRPEGTAPGQRATPVNPSDVSRPADRFDGRGDTDSVELSTDALRSRTPAELPPSGTLSPARVREIAKRIASGHYDKPEVQDTVLDRLGADLDTVGDAAE